MTNSNRKNSSLRHLGDLLDRVVEDTSLSPTRNRDVASDIRTLGRFLGLPLESITCDSSEFRDKLNALHPIQAGVSRKRLKNIRSSLQFALNRYRSKQPSLQMEPLTVEWQLLIDQLPKRNFRYGLTGFARYCSRNGKIPISVSSQTFSEYHQYLVDHSLRKHPDQVYRKSCQFWNRAAKTVPGWPAIKVAVPDFRKKTGTITINQFPDSLRQDVNNYLNWLSGKDLLSENQPIKPCKAITLNLNISRIQQLVTRAVLNGISLSSITSLEVLVSQEVVRASLGHFLENNGNRPTPYMRDLVKLLKRIARDWVGLDKEELGWYQQLIRRLDTEQPGLTAKNRETLRQFDNQENLLRLLELPDRLAKKAKKLVDKNSYRAAQLYLHGLVIEILIYAPMRVGNLASLRLDQHITRPSGARGEVIIVLLDSETKNQTPQEYPLPDSTRKKLNIYLKQHRPQLTDDPQNPWLWPDRYGQHKSRVTLSGRIKELIFKETGLKLTAHQFRHLSARIILKEKPGSYELVRRVLGHRNTSTTVNYYAGLESREAVAHYDELVMAQNPGSNGKNNRRKR